MIRYDETSELSERHVGARFKVDGVFVHSVEEYVNMVKAKTFFGGGEVKMLGDKEFQMKLRHVSDSSWGMLEEDARLRASIAKFTQQPWLLERYGKGTYFASSDGSDGRILASINDCVLE